MTIRGDRIRVRRKEMDMREKAEGQGISLPQPPKGLKLGETVRYKKPVHARPDTPAEIKRKQEHEARIDRIKKWKGWGDRE